MIHGQRRPESGVMGAALDAAAGSADGVALRRNQERMGFIVDNLVEASAPSNNPFLNPKVLKRVVDTGGGNLVEGGRRLRHV